MIFSVIILVISIIILFFSYYYFNSAHIVNREVDEENIRIDKENSRLKQENVFLLKEYQSNLDKQKALNETLNTIENNIEKDKQLIKENIGSYKKELEKKYLEEKDEWERSSALLKNSYAELQKQEKAELDKVRSTRAAAQKAITREKKIKENKDFYCLPCSVADRNDIQVLERVKKDLNNPRILSMLIWQTFFRTNATSLCNNVLGIKAVTGIYKITNQLTNECYIGQAVDVKKRFIEHMKCGLGIDTPKNNKLYKAMQEDGIWNFSFELLEKCSKDELNEKEKYYIELYMANDFGYNGNKGVSK